MRDLKIILDGNNATADDELIIVRDFLKSSKHANFYIRNKHSVDLNWFMLKKILNPRQVTKDFKRQGCGKNHTKRTWKG